MKKMLLGFGLILFSIAMFLESMVDPWIPILDVLYGDYIGVVSAFAGLVFLLIGTFKKEK